MLDDDGSTLHYVRDAEGTEGWVVFGDEAPGASDEDKTFQFYHPIAKPAAAESQSAVSRGPGCPMILISAACLSAFLIGLVALWELKRRLRATGE